MYIQVVVDGICLQDDDVAEDEDDGDDCHGDGVDGHEGRPPVGLERVAGALLDLVLLRGVRLEDTQDPVHKRGDSAICRHVDGDGED